MAPFLLRIPQVERTGGLEERSLTMCDYSLHNVKSRAARVGDKLTTRNFGTGTRGFAAQEDATMAVCVLPGTELVEGQEATVLQLPAQPTTTAEAEAQRRVAYVG